VLELAPRRRRKSLEEPQGLPHSLRSGQALSGATEPKERALRHTRFGFLRDFAGASATAEDATDLHHLLPDPLQLHDHDFGREIENRQQHQGSRGG